MGVIGGNGGYASIAPIQGNPIGDAMQSVENMDIKRRNESLTRAKMQQEADQNLQNLRRKEIEDSDKVSKENPFIATGYGIDAANKQSYVNAKNAMALAADNYSKTNDPKYLAIRDNALTSIKNIAEIPNQINKLKADNEAGLKDGSINLESYNRKKAIYDDLDNGNIVQTNDANANPKYTVFQRDENGKIDKLHYTDLTGAQLIQKLTPERGFNIDNADGEKGDSLLKKYQENIGKPRTIEENINGKIVKIESTPNSNELAHIFANGAIKNHSAVYKAFSRLGIDPENESNYNNDQMLQSAQNYIANSLAKTASTTTSSKTDYQGLQLAESKKEHAISHSDHAEDSTAKITAAKLLADQKAQEINNDTEKTYMYAPDGVTVIGVKTHNKKSKVNQNNTTPSTPTSNAWDNLKGGISKAFSGSGNKTSEKQKTTTKKEDLRSKYKY